MSVKFKNSTSEEILRPIISAKAAYFISGFLMAGWSPFIPYVKDHSGLTEGPLGMLLLCLGLGSVVFMPLTGRLTEAFGCRRVIILLAFLGCLALPLLVVASSPFILALILIFFGAATGGLDVASAIQGMTIQNKTGRQLMSVMLAFYSIGSILGPIVVSLLLNCGLPLSLVALVVSGIILGVLFFCQANLLAKKITDKSEKIRSFYPKGLILLIGCMCFTLFIAEGAIMDWGALFLIDYKGFKQSFAGIGYAFFSAAIALGRFMGIWLTALLGGERNMVLAGCFFAFISFLLTLFVLPGKMALLGFCLIGFGCANIVPILFSTAGKQSLVPTATAISTVSTLGYSGILIGPAFIGFIAHFITLKWTFLFLGSLMLVVAILSIKGIRKES